MTLTSLVTSTPVFVEVKDAGILSFENSLFADSLGSIGALEDCPVDYLPPPDEFLLAAKQRKHTSKMKLKSVEYRETGWKRVYVDLMKDK